MKLLLTPNAGLTNLGLQLNTLLDKGEHWNLDEVYEMAVQFKLVSFLETKIDLSLFDDGDKRYISEEFEALARTMDYSRKLGVDNNGLCLLLGFCFELIQNPPTQL